MSTRKCPDCDNPIKTCRELGGCGRGEPVEAHGVKGLNSTPWVKTFADCYALNAWAEKNSAEVHGTRRAAAARTSVERKDLAAAKERQAQRIAGIQARKAARHERLRAELVESSYGTPMPQIKLVGERGENQRAISAELHQLAAAVELATMKTADKWNVEMEQDHDTIGRVKLHLVEGDAAEAERGMALLNEVVRKARLAQAKAVPS